MCRKHFMPKCQNHDYFISNILLCSVRPKTKFSQYSVTKCRNLKINDLEQFLSDRRTALFLYFISKTFKQYIVHGWSFKQFEPKLPLYHSALQPYTRSRATQPHKKERFVIFETTFLSWQIKLNDGNGTPVKSNSCSSRI